MKPRDISQLEAVFSLRLQKRQQAFAALVAEEARLRGELQRMIDMEKAHDLSQTHSLDLVGVDLAWKTWLESSRKKLNAELAKILAQKAPMIAAMVKTHGESLVSEQLRKTAEHVERGHLKKRQMEQSIENHLVRCTRGPRYR